MSTLILTVVFGAALIGGIEFLGKLRRDERRRAIQARLDEICR